MKFPGYIQRCRCRRQLRASSMLVCRRRLHGGPLLLYRSVVYRSPLLPLPPPPSRRSSYASSAAVAAAGGHRLLLLERCTTLNQIMQVQAQMLISGLINEKFAASRLVSLCLAFPIADLGYGRLVLSNLPGPNAFSWNAAIRAHSDLGDLRESLLLYKKMVASDARPNNLTFPILLKVCAKTKSLLPGCQVLGHALQLGMISDAFVCNSAIHMLCSCGFLAFALQVFNGMPNRDLISWNSMINGYLKCGRPGEALELVRNMGIEPDEVTMIGAILCCAMLGDLDLGRKFHRSIEEKNPQLPLPLSNALIDMYIKCGSLEEAERLFILAQGRRTVITWTTMIGGYMKLGSPDLAQTLFDEMPSRDIVTWNVMIGGYVHVARAKDALTLFHDMQMSGVDPDEITMVHVFSSCAQLGALDLGLWAHRFIKKRKLPLNVALGTALIDMYAKCGDIQQASSIFQQMPEKNVLTWTAMVNGLAVHGLGHDAIELFSVMTSSGLTPDGVTFLGLLSACSHAGLVDHGRRYFDLMWRKYSIFPELKHYSCMVDLFGRAGRLGEAENLIRSMPISPDAVIWASLFFACRFHGNVETGERAAAELLNLDDKDGATFVMLAGMYGDASRWAEAGKVRSLMSQRGLEKTPGCSLIEVNGVVHEFKVRDQAHPLCSEIYACAMLLTEQMKLDVDF